MQALSNMATVGGIVSALNLTATSILTIGGKYREKVLTVHEKFVRSLLLVGFIVVVIFSATSAIAVVWVDGRWVVYLLSATFIVTVIVMVLTTLVFNAALAWNASDLKGDSK